MTITYILLITVGIVEPIDGGIMRGIGILVLSLNAYLPCLIRGNNYNYIV